MKKYLIFMLLFVPLLKGISQNRVILSEIMYDTPLNEVITAGVYSDGEFIELYNTEEYNVDLSGWSLGGGGKTEVYYFPDNTAITAKSCLVVAFRHKNSDFLLHNLFPGAIAWVPGGEILYQSNIVLSNSGESIVLKDNFGTVRDSIFYDGTSNKKKEDRLSAENQDAVNGADCLSLQRVLVFFDAENNAHTLNLAWITDIATPQDINNKFTDPATKAITTYAYDSFGNRVSKTIYITSNSSRRSQKKNSDDSIIEKLTETEIKIYPNPTKGQLIVEILNVNNEFSGNISLYNMSGSRILLRQIMSESTDLDVTAAPDGTYIMKITINDEISTWKIIKE